MDRYAVSERRACHVLSLPRSSHRYRSPRQDDAPRVVTRVHALSTAHPQYGYRKVHWILVREGEVIGREQVRQIRRREGLKVVQRKPVKKRRGRSTGVVACATHPHHVWSYDFLQDATADQ